MIMLIFFDFLKQRNAALYAANMYHHPYQTTQTKQNVQMHPSTYPIHPDVKLKKLPFYEVSAELIKPSSLVPQGNQRQQDSSFVFHLTPQQATAIGMSRDMRPGSKVEYAVQVQLRFCLLETTSEQEDCFPPGVMVKVNGKMCPLPVSIFEVMFYWNLHDELNLLMNWLFLESNTDQ